jgi:hypothetical protein
MFSAINLCHKIKHTSSIPHLSTTAIQFELKKPAEFSLQA